MKDQLPECDDSYARKVGGEMALDAGIVYAVRILREGGIETFESCNGRPGHAMPEPTIRFHGERGEGWRALAIATERGLPVLALRRSWPIVDGEPTGPWWEMTFRPTRGVVG